MRMDWRRQDTFQFVNASQRASFAAPRHAATRIADALVMNCPLRRKVKIWEPSQGHEQVPQYDRRS
jgi:hypothetical protein